MSVTLSVPQWTIGTTISLFQLPGSLTWVNPTTLTGDPYYGSMFSNTSNTIFLTGDYVACSTPGTLFTLKDTSANSYPMFLTVIPPSYTLSSAGFVYVSDASTNLPITFTPPTTIDSFLSVSDNRLIAGPSNIIQRTVSSVFTDYNIAPSLPNGLRTSIDASGKITIDGLPTLIRAQNTYTLYSRTTTNQSIATLFPLQVLPARYQFSNISGTVVVDTTAAATINYKKLNHIVVGVRGLQGVLAYSSVPSGMKISYAAGQIDISGTPMQFIDPPQKYDVMVANSQYSTKITYLLTMNPCLEMIVPTSVSAYSNVPYTSNAPLFKASVTGFPAACNSFVLSISGMNITQGGNVYGTINTNTLLKITAQGSLSNSVFVSVNAIPDAVTFNPVVARPLSQNVFYCNSFAASSSSGQPVTYSISPPFDGPIGLILNTSTGIIQGTPRGVSTQSNFTITARNPQGIQATLPIVLSTIADFITISSYGLYPYSISSLPMIQGHPVFQSEYPIPLTYTASSRSGDPIVGILSSNFPMGLSLTNGKLTGTPQSYGNFVGTVVARSLNGVTAEIPLKFQIAEDILILPISTDFVVNHGTTETYSLSGYTFSTSRIRDYALFNPPAGVLITSAGQLTIQAQTYQKLTSFSILATTYAGTTISTNATLTVNNASIGRIVSPSGPIQLPAGQDYQVITQPNTFLCTVSGYQWVSIVGTAGNQRLRNVKPGDSTIYPPELVTLTASSNLVTPVRVSTKQIRPFAIEGDQYRWTQYVPISPITISSSGVPSNVIYTVPSPPPGTYWNPIYSILTGNPSNLTIQDSFEVFATDGFSVVSFPIRYSVVSPVYLRTFAAPSAYTNYVKQRAFVNAAVHAINGVAYLPDPMIASETGPYPPDETKLPRCMSCYSPRMPPFF